MTMASSTRVAPSSAVSELLHVLAPVLSNIWARRKPGAAAAAIGEQARNRRAKHDVLRDPEILGFENHFGLSRSESSVCSLIRDGLKPRQIGEELGVSIATVRSHLRGIYAKTETSGQVELLHRLSQETTAQWNEPTARPTTPRADASRPSRRPFNSWWAGALPPLWPRSWCSICGRCGFPMA